MTNEAVWVSLFSGGKDSSWALYQARERGLPVERLVTVHPTGDSYLYHVPATSLAALAAESIGIELLAVEPDAFTGTDATARGDAELEPLEAALADLAETVDNEERSLAGLTVGAVASEYQHTRINAMAARLDLDVFNPLWQCDPLALGEEMLAAGFEIDIIAVAAGGLDETWLGRQVDESALAELASLAETHGVHPLGEGGEFETLVTDGPHMTRPIEYEATVEWDGTRGSLRIEDAWLGG